MKYAAQNKEWDGKLAKQIVKKMTVDAGDSKTNFDNMKVARNVDFTQQMYDEVLENAISFYNTLLKLAYSTE